MRQRQLDRSGLRFAVLTLGTITVGGKGVFAKTEEPELVGAGRLVDRGIDAGINLLDTADVYSQGRSKKILGQTLRDMRRSVPIKTEALGMAPAAAAQAWRPGVSTLVIGACDVTQLEASSSAVELDLSAEDRDRLDRVGASCRLGPADPALLGPHL